MNYHLAQLNIAQLLAPIDSPQLKDFVDNLERINTLAEQFEGFVWRLQTEEGDATALRPFGEEVIVNLSVWASVEALHQFVYRSAHTPIMSRRREWFARMTNTYMVLWWIPQGHEPSVEEAKQRLDLLQTQGASAQAFSFKQVFEQPSKAF
ncbi:DUF3291 domain-containing protein [uncultured Thiothrix sp.]|uniref:DUF3291 domain-containing protein n=1 Tax=uncultured Thiothrix sp. TaxID=223185 RepID=UPI0026058414|nr:DUF3291 domain-containing protein [uncultured Thiothrix sp.]HMT94231.1 DUF3291 domain-containing protein [Thiolinea sp.]